jgi:hypothetical protein
MSKGTMTQTGSTKPMTGTMKPAPATTTK